MKKFLILFVVCLLFVPVIATGQMVLNTFDEAPADTNYWMWHENVNEGTATGIGGHYEINNSADTSKGYIRLSYINDPVIEGSGAMQVDYSVHNMEGWGGFSKIEHWHPDSSATYDFSNYDSISVMYYNSAPQSLTDRIVFRLCLHDVSDSPNGNATYDVQECEYYYSFLYVLDTAPGWNEIKMPLMADANFWNGEGFNLTGWTGIAGNATLDLDKIKGFAFEFSISGAGEGDFSQGTIVFDNLCLTGLRANPFIFFNGKSVPARLSYFNWGQSTLEIEEGTGYTEGTNSLKWVQGDEWGNGWTGAGYNIEPPYNMAIVWSTDSLKFKLKAEAGTGAIRVQFEDGTAKVGQVFDPIADDAWHYYAFKLSEMPYQEDTSNIDSSAISTFQIMAEGTGVAGRTLYFDDIWTGNPEIDVVDPEAPTGVSAIGGDYYNLVIWEDVPGESGETYTVYASTEPISDLTDPEVDLVALDVGEDTQTAVHWIYYPLVEAEVIYYYAIMCKDEAGNESATFGVSSVATTNTAKGIPTISLNPPANFSADGDLSEWEDSGIMPFVLTPEDDYVPYGTIADSNDLKATVYLAIDPDYIYIAIDVVDDVFHYGAGNWWEQDAFEFFIGFYDARGAKHTSIKRGEEPDYKLIFLKDQLANDYNSMDVIYTPTDENYYYEDFGGVDYAAEAKVPLDSIAFGDDVLFQPKRGMRIPLEFYFHDNDGSGWEGNLARSPFNTDRAYLDPSEWEYTWIGDTTHTQTGVEDAGEKLVVTSYSLSQNYPNPFNPTTTIDYSLAKDGLVKVELYNTLGQKLASLVNEHKSAGRHSINFSGEHLSSGVYFYRIEVSDFAQTRKMLLMK